MAISPPSDIVLGVSEAAAPSSLRSAAERLQALGEMAKSRASAAPSVSAQEETSYGRASPSTVPDAVTAKRGNARVPDAFVKLEAFILQRFVGAMLPQNASKLFGKGIAGEFWKSMLAEKLGAELARSGQVGLARQLAAQSGQPVAGRGAAADGSLAVRPSNSLVNLVPYLNLPPPDPDTQS